MTVLAWVLAGIVGLVIVATVIAMVVLADRADEVNRYD